VLRNGQIEAFVVESSAEVASTLDQVGSLFRTGADIAVYFVDLSPLDISIFVGKTAKESVATDGATRAATTRGLEGTRLEAISSAARQIGWIEESGMATAVSVHSGQRLDVSELNILALSADKEVIQAECRLRLQIDGGDAEDLARFVALLKGKRALATWDIAALLRDECLARVLVPEIAKRQSSQLRGDSAVLHSIEQAMRQGLDGNLRAFGFVLDAFTILWGITPAEQAEIARKRNERAEQALDFAKTRQIAQLRRQQEIDKTRLANLQEFKLAKSKGDEDLADLLLGGEIRRDLMVKGKRVEEAQIDASVRDIQLSIEKNESMLRLEQRRANEELRLELEDRAYKQQHDARLASLQLEDQEMRSLVKAQIEISTAKRERELAKRRQELDSEFRKLEADVEDRYQQRKIKLEETLARMGMMERLLTQGLQTGAADSGVLTTMLEQATEQEYATTSDDKVRARADAQAAGQNLETYRQAEDRDRRHQAAMTGLAADLMDAAKQVPPTVSIPGAVPALSSGAITAPVFVANSPVARSVPTAGPASTCGRCNSPVETGWKACPHCGSPLQRACNACGAALQAGWEACPICGAASDP